MAKERPGAVRKAAKWGESKVGRRASFRTGRSPLPLQPLGCSLSLWPGMYHQIGLYLIVFQIQALRHCCKPDP